MSSTLSKVLWINLDRRADRARVQQKALEAAGAFTTGELFDAAVGCLINYTKSLNFLGNVFFQQKTDLRFLNSTTRVVVYCSFFK